MYVDASDAHETYAVRQKSAIGLIDAATKGQLHFSKPLREGGSLSQQQTPRLLQGWTSCSATLQTTIHRVQRHFQKV